jgi:hypothetical protein
VKKITATGIKEDGKPYRVLNAKVFRHDLDSLPPGRYDHTVEKARKKKSNPQLGYLFACVYPLVLQHLNDAGWEFTDLNQVDAFCKSRFADTEVINRHTGEIIMIPELKRNFTTTDMMTYIEAIRQWDAEYLGGYIPEPESQIKMNL